MLSLSSISLFNYGWPFSKNRAELEGGIPHRQDWANQQQSDVSTSWLSVRFADVNVSLLQSQGVEETRFKCQLPAHRDLCPHSEGNGRFGSKLFLPVGCDWTKSLTFDVDLHNTAWYYVGASVGLEMWWRLTLYSWLKLERQARKIMLEMVLIVKFVVTKLRFVGFCFMLVYKFNSFQDHPPYILHCGGQAAGNRGLWWLATYWPRAPESLGKRPFLNRGGPTGSARVRDATRLMFRPTFRIGKIGKITRNRDTSLGLSRPNNARCPGSLTGGKARLGIGTRKNTTADVFTHPHTTPNWRSIIWEEKVFEGTCSQRE